MTEIAFWEHLIQHLEARIETHEGDIQVQRESLLLAIATPSSFMCADAAQRFAQIHRDLIGRISEDTILATWAKEQLAKAKQKIN